MSLLALTSLFLPLAAASHSEMPLKSSSASLPHPIIAHDAAAPHHQDAAAAPTAQSKKPNRKLLPEKEERYEILPSDAIFERMQTLVANYPTFATLTTTQEWFGLPRAGGKDDCPFDKNYKVQGEGCNNYVLILQDKEAFPEDPDVQLGGGGDYYINQEDGWFKEQEGNDGSSEPQKSGWRYVPDVFLSGAVHGNERVGPSSLLEMAELLVEAAYCESLPRMKYKPKNDSNSAEEAQKWEQEVTSAKACRQNLASDKGIPSHQRQWLARLVSTRRTIIIPTANALGYSRDTREEGRIDPNRDFPFDITPDRNMDCMQTIAGRSINELFRSHLFPIGLTFHGGMEVVSYEWGAPTYLNKDAPDAAAQDAIASAYSRYANGFPGHVPYDYGTMNDKVYYVRGGMEDWAFAGSWDPERVVQCNPATFGGYPAEKTTYNNSTLRAFNMLIETSDPKAPARNELGKRSQPLVSSNDANNGHIARNMRLALLAMDVVEPYVSIRGVEGMTFEDDVTPGVNMRRYNGMSHFDNSKIVWVPGTDMGDDGSGDTNKTHGERKALSKTSTTTISWTAGGAFNIDNTNLIYGPWDLLPSNLADANDGTYPSAETMALINSLDNFITVDPSNADEEGLVGRSRWHVNGPHPTKSPNDENPTFEAEIDLSKYPPGTTLAIFAKAKVDKNWLEPAANVGPSGLGPVSHIVNARRNPNYFASNAGKIIRGRKDDWWYSVPITLVVGQAEPPTQILQEAAINKAPMSKSEDGSRIRAIHVNARLEYLPAAMDTVVHPDRNSSNGLAVTSSSMPIFLGAVAVAIVAILALVALVKSRRRKYADMKRVDHMMEEVEDGFSVGSEYRDDPDEGEIELRNDSPGVV